MNKYWENPEVLAIGRLPSRASFLSSGKRINLNGSWKFRRLEGPEMAGKFISEKDENWLDVEVPSLWTMDSRIASDQPIYTNVSLPFKGEPPNVPRNPTGIYRTKFHIKKETRKKRWVIYLGGIENCFFLYCNREEVGFSKDSRLPAEFDLTDYIRNGINELAIVVMRYSDTSYIENQDHWSHAGIHRDVFLYQTERIYLQDIFVKPDYQVENSEGSLTLDIRIGGTNRESIGYSVSANTFDSMDQPLLKNYISKTIDKNSFYPIIGEGPNLSLSWAKLKVQPWSAEEPHLYKIRINLLDPDQKVIESTEIRYGYRDIRIKDRELLVNSQPVLIKGVNRHDHSDTTGKIISEDALRKELLLMKQHNVNAIRTSHYPNQEAFYDLCDELGFYVIDEANIEAHQHYSQIGKDAYWAPQFMARATRMVERDKNHPCIIMWSVGNETGFGPNQMAIIAWLREYDPSRPIHNENAICQQGVENRWNSNRRGSDVVCPMYPSIEELVHHAKTSEDPRPLIICEYAHAMGNSCGNLKEYWDAIETWHGLQGGFIWEWKDHGIKIKGPTEEYWGYGGDFGEEHHDFNFVCDGLCWPDGEPHTSLLELKKVTQPVKISRAGKTFRILNKHYFKSLKEYEVSWFTLIDGHQTGNTSKKIFNTPPQHYEDFDLVIKKYPAGKEVSIVFECRLINKALWADRGHLVAWEQITIQKSRSKFSRTRKKTKVEKVSESIKIIDEDNELYFDESGLCKWEHKGSNILSGPLCFNFWRAPTDNDGLKCFPDQRNKALYNWTRLGLDKFSWEHIYLAEKKNLPSLRQTSKGTCAGGDIKIISNYSLTASALRISHEFALGNNFNDLPRIGVRWQLPKNYKRMSWFGKGPHETYPDRKESGIKMIHESFVKDQYIPYIMPQEHGNLTELEWLQLEQRERKIKFTSAEVIQGSASNYLDEDLTNAFHAHEVDSTNYCWVYLDAAQRGLGGASCGPDTLSEYKIGPGNYNLSYEVEII